MERFFGGFSGDIFGGFKLIKILLKKWKIHEMRNDIEEDVKERRVRLASGGGID